VTVDVYRPPARLGPRYPLWLKLTLIWGIAVIWNVFLLFLISAEPTDVPLIFLLPVSLIVAVAGSYSSYRIYPDRSPIAGALRTRGWRRGDTEDVVRPSDPEERAAARRLRRGAITRREYELIIARRRFVHGEITLAQYNEIKRQLAISQRGMPAAGLPTRKSS
jgi:uncharacterized membrane protein